MQALGCCCNILILDPVNGYSDIHKSLKEEVARLKEEYPGFSAGLAIVQVMLNRKYLKKKCSRQLTKSLSTVSIDTARTRRHII